MYRRICRRTSTRIYISKLCICAYITLASARAPRRYCKLTTQTTTRHEDRTHGSVTYSGNIVWFYSQFSRNTQTCIYIYI